MQALVLTVSLAVCSHSSVAGVSPRGERLQIEEIVVTAQKRSEAQQDVPISMHVTTAEMLEDYQISDMADVSKLSPGLDFGNTRNAFSAAIKMRGVGQDGVAALTGPAVVTFEDGLAQLDVGASIGTLLDVERIEVLRGPQGTLYGQNAPAGVVNIYTRTPHFDGIDGYLDMTYASFDTADIRGVVNLPIADGLLAARLGAFHSEADGQVDNEFLDRPAEQRESSGGRLKLLWLPMEGMETVFRLEYTDSSADSSPHYLDGPEPLNANEDVVELIGITGDFDLFDRKHFSDERGTATNIQKSAAVSVSWEIGPVVLTSHSQYQESSRTTRQDNNLTPVFDFLAVIQDEMSIVAQELRVANARPGTWEYVAGVFYRNDRRDNFSPVILAGDVSGNVAVLADVERKNLDFYGNLTWYLSEAWNVSAGLRFTNFEATSITFTRGEVTASATFVAEAVTGIGFPSLPGDLEPGVPVSLDTEPHPDPTRNDENVSASLKVRRFYGDDIMAYLAMDSGYRVGGFTAGLAGAENDDWRSLARYEDETSRSLELGFKSLLLDGRLQLNAAIFYQKFEDFQIGVFPGAAPNKPVTAFTATLNAEEATGEGGEVELAWLVNEHWKLSTAVAVAEVIADKFTRDICTPTEPRESEEQSLCDHSGAAVNADPKYYANFSAQYVSEPGWGDIRFFSHLLVSGRSDRDLITKTDRLEELSEAYATVDFNAGLRHDGGRWRATLWAKNVFDTEYVVATPSLHPVGDGTFVARGRAGPGRQVGLGVNYRF